MVGFKGCSSLKQYLPMKSTKRGFKIWCVCDAATGYMCNFEVYTGAGQAKIHGGLDPHVVLQPYKGLGHFFTVDLACHLLDWNSYCCGTARSDRKKFPSSLKKQKLDRGGVTINFSGKW